MGDALPGFEAETRPWSKTAAGYLHHLADLDYSDGWRFWALAHPDPELAKHRGIHTAAELEFVFLMFAGQLRHALIVIATGEVLATGEAVASVAHGGEG